MVAATAVVMVVAMEVVLTAAARMPGNQKPEGKKESNCNYIGSLERRRKSQKGVLWALDCGAASEAYPFIYSWRWCVAGRRRE